MPTLVRQWWASWAMDAAYRVMYCKVLDTWTGGYIGWGYFIVELWPSGTRFVLEPIHKETP